MPPTRAPGALAWAVTFAFVFLYHSFPLGLSDFWWHMASGRWIWEHGTLPVQDPFLFTSTAPPDARASQILQGYPLFQLLVFGAHSIGGPALLVALKAGLMTLFYGLLWANFRQAGVKNLPALAVVAVLPLLFFRFDDFRPQIFTFVFAALVLRMVLRHLDARPVGRGPSRSELLILPGIMILWANLHGGFIIGLAILAVAGVSAEVSRRRAPDTASARAARRLQILVALSMLAGLLNPAGAKAVWSILDVLSGPFAKVIDEYFGTLAYFRFHGREEIGMLVLAAALLPALYLLACWRELRVHEWLLVPPFLLAGLLSFRFSLLMMLVVLVVAARHASSHIDRARRFGRGIPMALAWALSCAMLAPAALDRTALGKGALEKGVIPASADFLVQSRPRGNLFNLFEYGGYLTWRLHPQRVFTDQRGLSWQVYEEYSRVWRGDLSEVFARYDIGVVLYTVRDRTHGGLARPVAALLADERWGVAYFDGRDIVLVRKDINPDLALIDKPWIYNDIRLRMGG